MANHTIYWPFITALLKQIFAMLNYSWKQYLLSMAIIAVIIFLVHKFKGSNEEFLCAKYDSFKHLEITGIVKKKLVDKSDHGNRIVIYLDERGDLKRLDLSFDASDLFKAINVGDSIFKGINKSVVILNNNEKYNVDYSVKCE
jgi:hypothetical protein